MKQILVIDDQTDVQTDFSILADSQTKVHAADGAENGAAIARQYKPDLIICSFEDDEAGLALLKKLADSESTSAIPVIYVSRSCSFSVQRQAMNCVADDFLPGPADPVELQQAVQSRFRKRKQIQDQMMDACRRSIEAEPRKPRQEDHILVTIGNRLQLIRFEEIICITALKEYSRIHTRAGKKIVVRKSLKAWVELLPAKGFLRIHRSSIINVEAIEKIKKVKNRTYVVHLKTLEEPLEFSQRYANVMRKTFSV